MEKTLLLIKPDAVQRNLIGEIISRLEKSRFKIRAVKMIRLKPDEARKFYAVHEGKPFLADLVDFMSSGPVVPLVLEKDNAVADLRDIIGATDPKQADPGTIRHDFALDKGKNSVHASDSAQTAQAEIAFFFPNSENSRR